MNKEIKFGTGFADAEILEYHRNRDDCNVVVKTWNDRFVKIRFLDVVGVNDIGIGDIRGIFEVDGSTTFLENVLAQVYTSIPATHPYRQFQFVNLDDEPYLQVVAAGIELTDFEEKSRASM